MTANSAAMIRVGIPVLRLLPWYRALSIMSVPGITNADPVQKLLVVPLAHFVWGVLALMPFVFLRVRWFFIAYVACFLTTLGVLAYDHFVPFRYVAPGHSGEISDPGGRFSRSGNDDAIAYWISYPTAPDGEKFLIALVVIAPLVLAFVYRRCFPRWTTKAQQAAAPNRSATPVPKSEISVRGSEG